MARFTGRTAYISGAASGIGRATATRFASEGASLFLTDVNESGLAETAAMCVDQGTAVGQQRCDVTEEDEISAAIQACIDEHGKLDVLVNNAGILLIERFADTSRDTFDHVMKTNLYSV